MAEEWKVWALCGTRPARQCGQCFRFDSGPALCRCKEPQFSPTTPASWTNTFFPERGVESGPRLVRVAKEICSQCPVRRCCLDYANSAVERFGIWGGAHEKQRRSIRAGRDPYVVCIMCGARVMRARASQVTCQAKACTEKAQAAKATAAVP